MKPLTTTPPSTSRKKVPPKKTLKRKQYSDEAMKAAVDAVKAGQSPFAAAKTFNVPRATLFSKVEGKYKSQTTGPDGYLNAEEENKLVDWIKAMGKAGFPITKNQLLDSVRKIVIELKRKNPDRNFPFADNRPGRHWFESFLRRHPDISMRVSQNLTSSRANVTEEKIRAWYAAVSEYIEANNLEMVLQDPRRIFNADEAAFFLNPKGNKVLFTRGEKCVYSIVNVDEKECLTVMMTCNAAGTVAPPMIVFQYERIPQDITDSINEDWGIGKSDNGWMTSAVFYEFITNIFYPWLIKEKIPLPIILFVDGHVSHLSLHTSTFCKNHGIVLVALHPNSTHIIQPMDVSVFRTLKGSWKEEINNWRMQEENLGKELKKRNFSPLLQKALKVVTQQVIQNGFRKCGLYPWDANAINYGMIKSLAPQKDADRNNIEAVNPVLPVIDKNTSKKAIALEILEDEIGPLKLELFLLNNFDESWRNNIEVRDHGLFEAWRNIKNENDLEVECTGILPVINEDDLLQLPTSMVDEMQVLAMEPHNESMVFEFSRLCDDFEAKISSEAGEQPITEDPTERGEPLELGEFIEAEKPSQVGKGPGDITEAEEPPETKDPLQTGKFTEVEKRQEGGEMPERRTPQGRGAFTEAGKPSEARKILGTRMEQNQNDACFSKAVSPVIENISKFDDDEGETSNNNSLLASPFKRLLVYPERRQKDLKRRKQAREVIPFVISGKHYQEYYKRKEEKKKEQELLKTERIRKRKEKAEEKAKAQELKNQKKKTGKKTTVNTPEESSSNETEVLNESLLDNENICINMYVIVRYEGEYFPGIVLEKKYDGATVKVMGMAGVDTWKWPDKDDVLFYEKEDIICKIDFPQLKNSRGHYFVPDILKFRKLKN